MNRIAILVYDGFDELDAIGPYEVLRNAGFDARLVTLRPAEAVTASHGLQLRPHALLDDSYDLVLVPGGGWADRAQAGAWAEIQRGELPAALRELQEGGTPLAAVCTGTMLLSAAGVTRERPATTHHAALKALAEEGAEVIEERVVDDGDLITAGGVTSGIDLALWLVERERGRDVADAIARGMEHPRQGRVWRAQTGAE